MKVYGDVLKPTCSHRKHKDHTHATCDHADRLFGYKENPHAKATNRLLDVSDRLLQNSGFQSESLSETSKSTFHHPLGDYNIIKGLSRKVDPCLRTTLYRGPAA